ncbi:MAG: exonuclease SbcCD subunit D C-terminal domain-containing protein [Saprospiraceae bacterium]|nr:exonuclease SbcCD subunit D C-terminal domain-containing protein [Saprospiraceae bacterium]
MKILHTSDWHLGQKFLYKDREAEHQLALHLLVELIFQEQIEGLIVAGDIFDISNPPNYARRLYYNFLTALLKSPCRHILITGGNHDSPAMLDAPKELLAALNVHVVGAATDPIEKEIIEWKNNQNELEAVIAAVPFLRDGDLRFSVAGESGYERVERVREGILKHYHHLGNIIKEKYAKYNIPIITTGHLYIKGALASEKQDNIYIGDKENMDAAQFPEVFDYVALGHIHRAQAFGKAQRVRYSGSLIPLSFSETKDDKSVYILDFQGKKLEKITTIPVPVFRRLKTIEGTLQEVEEALKRFDSKGNRELTPWVEVIVHTDCIIPQLDVHLQELTKDMNLELMKIRLNYNHHALDAQIEEVDLKDLDQLEVFYKKCESYGAPPDEMEELTTAFLELRHWMNEQEVL